MFLFSSIVFFPSFCWRNLLLEFIQSIFSVSLLARLHTIQSNTAHFRQQQRANKLLRSPLNRCYFSLCVKRPNRDCFDVINFVCTRLKTCKFEIDFEDLLIAFFASLSRIHRWKISKTNGKIIKFIVFILPNYKYLDLKTTQCLSKWKMIMLRHSMSCIVWLDFFSRLNWLNKHIFVAKIYPFLACFLSVIKILCSNV